MGGGRAPCCDKNKVKRGPWSPAEDFKLANFIQKNGHPNWRSLPKQAGQFSSPFISLCMHHACHTHDSNTPHFVHVKEIPL